MIQTAMVWFAFTHASSKNQDVYLVKAKHKTDAVARFTQLVSGRFGFFSDLTTAQVREDIAEGNLVVQQAREL